jgi:NADPH:quinone reductase-like Zn-dependent oxidoreductase
MLRIVHHHYGEPAKVLAAVGSGSLDLPPDQVRVSVSLVPIHPGDLLGIEGSPAFGEPPSIGPTGRVPGFEGAGVISEVGRDVDPSLRFVPGQRVAFFPAVSSWAEEVSVA